MCLLYCVDVVNSKLIWFWTQRQFLGLVLPKERINPGKVPCTSSFVAVVQCNVMVNINFLISGLILRSQEKVTWLYKERASSKLMNSLDDADNIDSIV